MRVWRKNSALVMVLAGVLVAASCSRAPDSGASAPEGVQTASTGQVNVTFASESNPPKTGDNNFLVTVTQPDGTPITDGQVTAVFSMPAMPSMNMPAMRSDATLTHESGGGYKGTGQLSMSGTWNVTVSVTRSGQELGSARFSVVAK